MKRYKALSLMAVLLSGSMVTTAQTITEKDTTILTYGYSDPDPVPRIGNLYPYERFQGFEFQGTEQTWKMVVLENDFLRVKIFPQIGGKVWSIYDKTAGKELFYDNSVIKFRDIAMRGPWTSGGIEFNYGIIGHAPSCAHPVDYKTEKKADGSVSCYIGVMELLTRTRWMVEVNLPKDAVWVRTRSFWHNYSGQFQPYYTWANSGVTASDDLQLIYPATYSIGHGGEITPYPIDEKGRDLSKYNEQAFGADKSLHPGGSHKGYFGVYWANDDCGMLHYALRDEKLGRKYFSWAQSEQGSIWKGLLTDTNPQYVELQSGRLFNQNATNSVQTPYKQFFFTPYGTDEWNDYWLPFSHIGTADDMTLRAVAHVQEKSGKTEVGIYPLQKMEGEMLIQDAQGKPLTKCQVTLSPAQAFNKSFELSAPAATILVDGHRIWSADKQETDRPNTIRPEFSLTSAQGFVVHGRYLAGMRLYGEAEQKADSALAKDSTLLDALNLKAMLCLRRMKYQQAYETANKVLAVDAYDPQANYLSGLAAWRMGKDYDAMDRLELAAITAELRSAAYTRLAEIHFVRGDKDLAAEYARKSLRGNQANMTALQILYQYQNDEALLNEIEQFDPLSHYPNAERLLAGKLSADEFRQSIREELCWQNYLELAAFFHRLGLDTKAVRILEACPDQNILTALWKAYLQDDKSAIAEAEKQPIERIFPFREESYAPLAWAVENGGSWQSRYQLAMLKSFIADKEEAKKLMQGNESDYAPYYAFRYILDNKVEDMEKALSLDKQQWRYACDLASRYIADGQHKKAVDLIAPRYKANKKNFHVASVYAKALMETKDFVRADAVIEAMDVLPFEGQYATRTQYRTIKMTLARQYLDKKQYRKALKYAEEAKLWPTHLGVGKPYEVNTKEEDDLIAQIREQMK